LVLFSAAVKAAIIPLAPPPMIRTFMKTPPIPNYYNTFETHSQERIAFFENYDKI